MALLASRREARMVYRRLRIVVIRLVARNTGGRRNVEVAVGMAARARRGQVRASQRPSRR